MSKAIKPEQAATNRHIEAFLTQLNSGGGKPMEQMEPKEAREVLIGAQKSVEVDLSGIETTEKTLIVDEHSLTLSIVRPIGHSKKLPVFMFFHGGGWILGDFPTHKRLVRDLVVGSGAVAVFVNYTPSPEAHYPVAINQAYAATKWVAEHADEINVDASRLAVAGNSVGGNMAAVVALMAKEKGTPHIAFQLLLWPVTEYDVLRDEGEAYGRKLNEAGVEVTLVRYDGLIHDYGLLNPLATIPAVKTALAQAAAALRHYLE